MMTNVDFENLTPVFNFDPDRGCFGCGQNNPHGLKMTFRTDGLALYTRLTVPRHLAGWDGIVHGGVVATMLDEMMGWSAIHLLQRVIVTKGINIQFLHPLRVDQPLQVVGRVQERTSRHAALMTADILDVDDRLCATAEGQFALFTIALARRFKIFSPHVLDRAEHYFQSHAAS